MMLFEYLNAVGGKEAVIWALAALAAALLMLIFAFSAQRWAHRCYLELKEINERERLK